jgi:hypothetical protein
VGREAREMIAKLVATAEALRAAEAGEIAIPNVIMPNGKRLGDCSDAYMRFRNVLRSYVDLVSDLEKQLMGETP